jgi:NAD+ synthase
MSKMKPNDVPEVLRLDCEKEVDEIGRFIRSTIRTQHRRKGAVVGISGGVDSSVTAALCVSALGKERVFGLLMPERDSGSNTIAISTEVVDSLEVDRELIAITDILAAAGCYRSRDDAFRSVIPEYGEGWKAKIVLPDSTRNDSYNFFSVVARSPDGEEITKRLPLGPYLQIVAATNFKQRTRKMLEYFHADRLHYAVAGTPNRLEYDQGFFVKLGDGAADLKPIAHLYKTQVYQLASYLGVPESVTNRPPTTDTYSLPQEQDEFYFRLPYDKMDLCLYGKNEGLPAAETAEIAGLSVEQVEWAYGDIEAKRRTTAYLHAAPAILRSILPEGT